MLGVCVCVCVCGCVRVRVRVRACACASVCVRDTDHPYPSVFLPPFLSHLLLTARLPHFQNEFSKFARSFGAGDDDPRRVYRAVMTKASRSGVAVIVMVLVVMYSVRRGRTQKHSDARS